MCPGVFWVWLGGGGVVGGGGGGEKDKEGDICTKLHS